MGEGNLRGEVRRCPPRTAADLFSGCGGMSLGLNRAGFDVVYANEINESAAATYSRNFPGTNIDLTDIRKVNLRRLSRTLEGRKLDLLVAGLPCQGFSSAGARNSGDSRNLLFRHVLRFARAFRPRIIVLENVEGMLARRNLHIARNISRGLRRAGYYPKMRVLAASSFGVPQRRRRVIIIACSRPVGEEDLFPTPPKIRVSVSAAISDLRFLGVGESSSEYRGEPRSRYQEKMRGGSLELFNHQSSNHSLKVQRRFASIPTGGRHASRRGTKKLTHFKLNPRKVANTITSIPEDTIHYSQNRGLTVREMARLQSFPDSFEFLGPRTTGGPRRRWQCPQYTQVANAVPPLLAEYVFRRLLVVLNRRYPVGSQSARAVSLPPIQAVASPSFVRR